MASSFRALLEALDAAAAMDSPSGVYTHGSGLAAHTLMRLLVDPETPPAARVAAIKEIADRCEGKTRVASDGLGEAGVASVEDLRLAQLTDEQFRQFAELLKLVGWGHILDQVGA